MVHTVGKSPKVTRRLISAKGLPEAPGGNTKRGKLDGSPAKGTGAHGVANTLGMKTFKGK